MPAQSIPETPILDYQSISKPEAIFAAIWHNPEGTVSTEAIAQYYQIETSYLLDVYEIHHEEIGVVEEKWTPRAAIRIGLLLNSPIATAVRSLSLDVIEAYKQPSKQTSIRYLLENTQFVEWSDRAIARILECSPTLVGGVRKKLEDNGNILQFKKRKHLQGGKEIERNNEDSNNQEMSTGGHLSTSKPDSIVNIVQVSSQLHPNYGEVGILGAGLNDSMHTIHFDNGEVGRVRDDEYTAVSAPILNQSAPIERNTAPPPTTYTEEQLQSAITRAIEEAKIGYKVEMEAIALRSVQEELAASRAIASSKALEVAKLQQTIEELQSLRLLEVENQQLQQRIGELERALEKRPVQEWGNTLTKQAEKTININTIKAVEAMEADLHLRALAISPPNDATEAMRLMTLAIGNLAVALNDTNALSAAATLLKCEPIPDAIATSVQVCQAVHEIRQAVASGCQWQGFWAIAQKYPDVKTHYWRELDPDERNFISKLKEDFDNAQKPAVPIQVGDAIAHSDQYSELYIKRGVVAEEINDEEVLVLWSHDAEQKPKRYFKSELRILEVES